MTGLLKALLLACAVMAAGLGVAAEDAGRLGLAVAALVACNLCCGVLGYEFGKEDAARRVP